MKDSDTKGSVGRKLFWILFILAFAITGVDFWRFLIGCVAFQQELSHNSLGISFHCIDHSVLYGCRANGE